MNARTLLTDVVTKLREIPPTLSGDDSVLTDTWEETKYQVQGELSFIWLAYLDAIKGCIDSAVVRLRPGGLLALSTELKAQIQDESKIRHTLLLRVLARARKEKVRYEPLGFEYFWYSASGICIYNHIVKRTGMHTCWVLAHSGAAPFGEQGEIDLAAIDRCTECHDSRGVRTGEASAVAPRSLKAATDREVTSALRGRASVTSPPWTAGARCNRLQ